MRSEFKVICCTILLLFPLVIRGQQSNGWGNGKLRESVLTVSSDIPFAIIAYDFAERYLTELKSMSDEEQRSRMERDGVLMLQGNITRLSLIGEHTSLTFAEKNDNYRIGFFNEGFPLMEIQFPASCQLLLGKNLKELEKEWIEELNVYPYTKQLLEIKKEELKFLNGKFYILEGNSYNIESIHSHQYFEEKRDGLEWIFSMDHPAESVSNLFVSESVGDKVSLNLTIRKYGLKKEQKELPINKWVAYQKSKGCEIFVGIEELKSDRILAMIFVVNSVLKYNHVMNVEIPYELLVKGEGCINGDINLFIPTHNIKSLFDELNSQKITSKSQIKVQ